MGCQQRGLVKRHKVIFLLPQRIQGCIIGKSFSYEERGLFTEHNCYVVYKEERVKLNFNWTYVSQRLADLQNADNNANKVRACIHGSVSVKPTYACCKVYHSSSLSYWSHLLLKQNYWLSHLKVYLQNIPCYRLVSHEVVWVCGLHIFFNV